MHVLHIGIYPPPYGGISTHIYRVKQFLEESGISCSVIDWSGDVHPTKKLKGNIYTLTGSRFARWIHLTPIIKRLKPDLIHVHISSGNSFHWVAGPILLSSPAKKFVTIHSSSFVKNGGLYRPFVKRLLNRMDQIVVVNETIREAIAHSKDVSTPVCVIPAYIDPQAHELSNPDQEIQELVIKTKAKFNKVVMISGFVTPDYSFDKALDALEKINRKDICLFIVGYSQVDSDYYAHLQSRISAFNGNALWLENLPHASFLYLLSNMDIYIRAQNFDGDSIAVREALSLGTRVLASDGVPRPKDVNLFQLEDIRSLTNQIIALLESEHEIGRRDSPKNVFAHQLLTLYKSSAKRSTQ